MTRYEPTARARELSGRALLEFAAAVCLLCEGDYWRAKVQLRFAEESADWALAWHWGLIGDLARIRRTIVVLLTRERLDRELAAWRGVAPARLRALEERSRLKVRAAVEREQRKKAVGR